MRGFKSSQTPRTWLHTGTGSGVQVSQSEAWSSTDTSPQTSRLQSCQWIGDSAIAVTHSQPEGSLTPLPQSRRYDTRTKAAGFCSFLFFFLTLCLEIYTLQEENMLFFYFIVSFFQFKKKKKRKKRPWSFISSCYTHFWCMLIFFYSIFFCPQQKPVQ